jgi:hypothetical protein
MSTPDNELRAFTKGYSSSGGGNGGRMGKWPSFLSGGVVDVFGFKYTKIIGM